MTETISAFLFIAALTLGFSDSEKRADPIWGVLSMAFRVNF